MIPITNCINKCISTKSFPDALKVADVIPVFKKEDPNNKRNYRPISLLPIISKIFERVLFEQIEKFCVISDYLSKRYQRVKLGSVYSSYLEILRGVPQGSILGPILFNIFINDLIFFIQETEVCNFADDTTIYSCSLNYKEAAHKLSNDTHVVLNCFKVNSMVANPGKFQMFLGCKTDNSKITFAIENKQIKCKREVKLLRISTDEKLTFTKHIANAAW